ncbi:hypothetical protein AAFF_G00331810 [Aldrovandia affinis]|uniref:Uncharacterized protein n=1 Tax=Aldrovandia affinis TaxID=143900 RepID=A0AAD7SLI0_9TELE|nr:hypothetical protein AAFF_G00331810 [Aldrovandia affinis]
MVLLPIVNIDFVNCPQILPVGKQLIAEKESSLQRGRLAGGAGGWSQAVPQSMHHGRREGNLSPAALATAPRVASLLPQGGF